MTLKEKFENPIMRHDLGRNEIEETKEQCAEIADEYAIEFSEWSKSLYVATDYKFENTKELLEIYKKEKGL